MIQENLYIQCIDDSLIGKKELIDYVNHKNSILNLESVYKLVLYPQCITALDIFAELNDMEIFE